MPRFVWNKPTYLGRQGSSREGLWMSHLGLPPELSCSPGSSSSMLITADSLMNLWDTQKCWNLPHTKQGSEHVPIGCFITTKNGSFDSPLRSAHWGFIRSGGFPNAQSSCWATYTKFDSLVAKSCLTLLRPPLARVLCPWDFSGRNTGVGCHFHHQGIFPTQALNSSFLH